MANKSNQQDIMQHIKKEVIWGVLIVLIFFGLLGLWSVISPLYSAAVAPGRVIVSGEIKTIQHLEGGIVKQIHVDEGSQVKEGDPLITLDSTQSQASYDILQGQINELLASEARLIALRDDQTNITWPDRLLKQKNNPKIEKIMKGQESLFKASLETYNGQVKILNQRVTQLQKQIDSLDAQLKSGEKQLKFINEELVVVAELRKRKLIDLPRLLALRREAARLEGIMGEKQGLIAKSQQEIGETQQQIITLKDNVLKDYLKELRDVQTKLADLQEKEKATEYVLGRTVIKAPVAGTVVSLREHTIGGVVTPGEAILDLVPQQANLIVEARVRPLDIDNVHQGLIARVRLSAYKQRNMPVLVGTVRHVSAKAIEDPNTHEYFYAARVLIPGADLDKLKNVKLYPGMPVEVMIITDRRTPFRYIFSPIYQSFDRAFRED